MIGPLAAWPVQDFLRRTGARVPIVQAPMAGAGGVALAAAAIRGGAVGSLPCAMLTPDQVREQVAQVRAQAEGPLNLNFFCHQLGEAPDETAWRTLLKPFYVKEGVGPPTTPPPLRTPFDDAMCMVVEDLRPDLISFHFGLPDPALLDRVRATGALILGNATNPKEARWLAAKGCDAIIAQAAEAGGHAGWFLDRHRPIWLPALLRQVLNAVDLPIIAAGGMTHGGDIGAALRAGATAVQVGTAYLACPESLVSSAHRSLLGTEAASETAFTALFSGRSAQGIRNALMRQLGEKTGAVPAFPYASAALASLRAKAEAEGRGDYSPLWAGTGAAKVRPMAAEQLTRLLADETLAYLALAEEN